MATGWPWPSKKGRLVALLSREVKTLANALTRLPDAALRQDWSGMPGEGDWAEYSDNLSDIVYLVYQRLREFEVTALSERARRGPEVTMAQWILAQHQLAYRDLHGVLGGVRDEELDQAPFEGEWSLRDNLAHIMLAEWWAQRPQIQHALRLWRSGQSPAPMPPRELNEDATVPVDYGTLVELLDRFDSLHDELVEEFASISEEELGALSVYWEKDPVEIRFRLCRFAWHLRGHALQADKIRVGIGHRLTDAERLVRYLYSALGDAEGALIGGGASLAELERECSASINRRVIEVEEIAGAFPPEATLPTPSRA
jgi:hypothetical protein